MTGQNIQPIFILPESASRSLGREAQKTNIEAAKAVANTVKSTLGPKGMDKMLVNQVVDIVLTDPRPTRVVLVARPRHRHLPLRLPRGLLRAPLPGSRRLGVPP